MKEYIPASIQPKLVGGRMASFTSCQNDSTINIVVAVTVLLEWMCLFVYVQLLRLFVCVYVQLLRLFVCVYVQLLRLFVCVYIQLLRLFCQRWVLQRVQLQQLCQ